MQPPACLMFHFIMFLVQQVGAKKHHITGEPMPHHSFQAPMEVATLLDDWVVSGASYFARDSLLLHPGVPSLAGFAWHAQPVLTEKFEVTLLLRFQNTSQGSRPPSDQHIAFWYVSENISDVYKERNILDSKDWQAGLHRQGFTLAGSKAKFVGFGVVLSPAAGPSKKPLVSYLRNADSRELSQMHDLPAKNAREIDFLNTGHPVKLRIRVRPTGIEGHIRLKPHSDWMECFETDTQVVLHKGGYIGMTGFSGSIEESADGASPDAVNVQEFQVKNFDSTSIGEAMTDMDQFTQKTYQDLLEHERFADQHEQTVQIESLIDKIDDYLSLNEPAEMRLVQQVHALTTRVDRLADSCRSLEQETHVLLKTSGNFMNHSKAVNLMKREIEGLKTVLTKHSKMGEEKLTDMEKNIRIIKEHHKKKRHHTMKFTDLNTAGLERSVRLRSEHHTFVLFIYMGVASGTGMLLWRRLVQYEKKHFI